MHLMMLLGECAKRSFVRGIVEDRVVRCPKCDCILIFRSMVFDQWWCENCLKWFIEPEYNFTDDVKETSDDSQDS